MAQARAFRRRLSYGVRYASKRLRFAWPGNHRPAVTYGTYRTSSTAIHHAIRRQLGGRSIKAHALAPKHLGSILDLDSEPVLAEDGVPLCAHYGNHAVRRGILLPGRPADFVLTVRDPVAVAASLFYSFSSWWSPRLRAVMLAGRTGGELHDAIDDGFFGCFPRKLMLDWLSQDVPGGLGWDLLRMPFDADRGWQEYSHGQLRILVLRADVQPAEKQVVLRRFLNAPELVLRHSNSGLGYGRERPALAASVREVIRSRRAWLEEVAADPRTVHLWGIDGARKMLGSWLVADAPPAKMEAA